MRSTPSLITLCLASAVACTLPTQSTQQGGNNTNDRTNGGEQGETLLTGAMVVSPDGKFALVQRNRTSVLLDVEARTARELPEQVSRFVFAMSGGFGVAVLPTGTAVSYALPAMTENWRVNPPLQGSLTLARLDEAGRDLVLSDASTVVVLDASTGATRNSVRVRSMPAELSFVPGTRRALVVGTTQWTDHKPRTEVVDLDLTTVTARTIEVPNCTAPVAVLPDATRAFLSPTFCEEAKTSTGKQTWTNPDPVSVIDLTVEGPRFLKNLPGFGPVAMDTSARRVVAYLDMQRIDESMFEDRNLIPDRNGARYHIMTIEPRTLAYQLSPVGNVLPRFAMGTDGKTLLVDATVQQLRGEASFKATIDTSGKITARLEVFGKVESLFGAFDLDSRVYTPFSGPAASLDRFVQTGDATRVFTLKMTADGMGGDLYRIDLDSKSTTKLGKSLRDIGLLADQKTLVLRERLPAVQVQTSAGIDWYRKERYCFSLDGITCQASVEFQDAKPFQSGPACRDYHDC